MPLAAHEYTHFLDSTSTVWGLRHLKLMDAGYRCDDRLGGVEEEYFSAKCFYDHVKSIRLPNYYTLIDASANKDSPWSYRISLGKKFSGAGKISSRPVIFSQFLNSSEEMIVRSPISMVSMLEASAMFQEINFHKMLVNLCEENFRHVERWQFRNKILDGVYNYQLTEYSVCAHIVAVRLRTNYIEVALAYCALLVRVCLNATDQMIAELGRSADVAEILSAPRDHDFVCSVLEGLRLGDRAVLFYLLSQALPANLEDGHDPILGVRAAASRLGIDLSNLQILAKAEAQKLSAELNKSPFQSIRELAQSGLDNMFNIDSNIVKIEFNNLHLPPALLSDGNVMSVFNGNNLSNFDINKCFNELYTGQSWVERFSEACLD